MNSKDNRWYKEYLTPNLLQMVSVKETIFTGKTRYQKVEILDTFDFGKTLILDGKTQSSEADEFVYHEALVQPAMTTHENPMNIFIAGGGEGATLREVLSHNTVKKAVMVDLDGEVVDICRRFLTNHHKGAFDDIRTELHFNDAKQYLINTSEKFDVMIIDLPDPQEGGPASFLYTKSFYSLLKDKLNPNGIVAIQSEQCMTGNMDAFTAIVNTLTNVFPKVYPYHAMIPSFSFDWGFTLASLGPNPKTLSREQIDQRLKERDCNTLSFYDGELHQGIFTLSKSTRNAINTDNRVITDSNPLFVL